jgi:hypothetical protein
VISERYDSSEIADLYDYTVACGYEEVAERCRDIIRGGDYAALGLAALAKFREQTSMHDNMARALALPVFERLGAA